MNTENTTKIPAPSEKHQERGELSTLRDEVIELLRQHQITYWMAAWVLDAAKEKLERLSQKNLL